MVWVAAYRHPLQTAKSFGTIDHLSGGRVILGVGAGHLEAEFDALGIAFHDRGARLDEALEAIRGAFADHYVSFSGNHFGYERMGVSPQPVNGTLPVWVGGAGRAAWRRAGRFGDGYIPMAAPVTEYPAIADAVREAAVAGRAEDAIAIGYMPPASYLTGRVPRELGNVDVTAPDALIALLRAAREGGADVMHVRFRDVTLDDYLEQLDAFAELVAPHVD